MIPTQLANLIGKVESLGSGGSVPTKDSLAKLLQSDYSLTKERSVLVGQGFAVRISKATGASFSNTVLGLGVLRKYDANPFVVIVVRPNKIDMFLANSTFLKKISHSSRDLREDNIRGSFLGHDIMSTYQGMENSSKKVGSLFAKHKATSWEVNFSRLVAATAGIIGQGVRFALTASQRSILLQAPARSRQLIADPGYGRLKKWFDQECQAKRDEILRNGEIDNVNIRGNSIEQIITASGNAHRLDDLTKHVGDIRVALEIKTKLMNRSSSPKAYNLDKAFRFLSQPNTALVIGFIGIDTAGGKVTTNIVSIFDQVLLSRTAVQHHWAGRNSLGATQFAGQFDRVINPGYVEMINVSAGKKFIESSLA